MKGRDIWLKLHRWLGLGIGIVFFIASLTGAVLMYEQELDAWFNRGEYRTTPGDVGVETIVGTVRASFPAASIGRIEWPAQRNPIYQVQVIAGEAAGEAAGRLEPGERRTIALDPGSGSIIEPVRGRNRIVPIIRRMHTSLLASRPGHEVVTYGSLLALFSMVTGLVLWWPGIRRFFRGFGVRLRRGFYAFNFDLHQTIGAIALPVLFVITLSGVMIPFWRPTERLLRAVLPGSGSESTQPVRVEGATASDPTLAPLTLVEIGRGHVPDGELRQLRMPAQPGDPALVEFFTGSEPRAAGWVVGVLLDPRDGSLLRIRNPQQQDLALRIALIGSYNVHVGAFGGEPVRIIYVLTCVIGAFLALGGTLIWWLKREMIRAAEKRRAERAAVQTSLQP